MPAMAAHLLKKSLSFVMVRNLWWFLLWIPLMSSGQPGGDSATGIFKVRDVIIYHDSQFYAAFPSVVKTPEGRVLVAFRRAPDRKVFSERGTSHVDANSYLVQVMSSDGIHWDEEPQLMYAHPFGGSQDPCLLQLHDGTLLCSSYGWAFVRPEGMANLRKPYFESKPGVIFLGGYTIRSADHGTTWQGPYYPPHIVPEVHVSALGNPLPAYNRGAMCQLNDGRIFWVVAASDALLPRKTSNHLLVSNDQGISWEYACPVAVDETASFNEASLYETPKGDLLAFLRTADLDDQACIARSTDGGKSFQPWQKMGFQGHPLHALRLPDRRILLTYGYRHQPYGIRARVLNEEGTDYATAPEIILRDDGGTIDLGYPWAIMLDNNHVLVVYYFNIENGTRFVGGTVLGIGD